MMWRAIAQQWFENWELSESLSPGVEFDLGDSLSGDSAASLIVENGSATAQVIVWNSGSCDSSFGRFDGTVEDMLIESWVLTSEEELVALIDRLYLLVSTSD
jgi:hypothetical protein